MNKKYICALCACMMVLASCSGTREKEDDFVSDGAWHVIKPQEIPGNFVSMMDNAMLLSAGSEGDFNTMAMGWGGLGKFWRRPTLTVYVSSSRYTYEFMEKNSYFTVCGFPEEYKNNVMYMGKHSGRDGDKVADGGLHAEFTELGNPMFSEANLVVECKLLYEDVIDTLQTPIDIKSRNDKSGPYTMYVGEIVNVMRK